jgi:hypothetical protein
MVPSLIQHLADHVHQRHVLPQRLGENSLALIGVGVNKTAAEVGQQDVAFLQQGEAEQLQRLSQRQQIVPFVLQGVREGRQIRPSVVRFGRKRFHQT